MQHRRIGTTEQAGRLGKGAFWVFIALVLVAALGVLTHREVHLRLNGLGTLSVTSPPNPLEEPPGRRSRPRPLGQASPASVDPHWSPRCAGTSTRPAPCEDAAGSRIIASPTGGIQNLEAKP